MLFISPPFGNYINFDNCISISGSFTLNQRNGLIYQIFKTLRYSFKENGWINKIGLRNKGIDWALKNIPEKQIISVAIMNECEIPILLKKIPDNRNIEINISCPNVDKETLSSQLSKFINIQRKWCIIKISPTSSNYDIDKYYNMGFRQFHCCNTIPVPQGGLSGSSLIPFTTNKIMYINEKYKDSEIIAGGGIRYYNDVLHYKSIGAKHFSISTLFFNPLLFSIFYYNYNKNKC